MTKISFSNKEINFGTVSTDTNLIARFYIKNIVKEKLIIKEVSPECGCTDYKLASDTVLMGDSTKLTVKLRTIGKGKGLHRTAVIIGTNTPKEYHTLFLKYIIKE